MEKGRNAANEKKVRADGFRRAAHNGSRHLPCSHCSWHPGAVPRHSRPAFAGARSFPATSAKCTSAESSTWPIRRMKTAAGPAPDKPNPGTVGMSLMVFLASGEDPNFGKYSVNVRRCLRSIINSQDAASGYLGGQGGQSMYHHGFGMLAWLRHQVRWMTATCGPTARMVARSGRPSNWPYAVRSRRKRRIVWGLALLARCPRRRHLRQRRRAGRAARRSQRRHRGS